MDIHEMIGAATTSIRAMQITLETTQKKLANSEEDNNRLREAYAKETAARLNAQADLVHFQTVFEANVCLEAMKICKKMFTLTHDSMLAEASEAVKRMVEEKQAKETEERAAKTVDDIETERERIADEGYVPEAPAHSTDQLPEEGSILQAPAGISYKETKQFYNHRLGYLPPEPMKRPIFVYRDGVWVERVQTVSFAERKMRELKSNEAGQQIPSTLSAYLSGNGKGEVPSRNVLRSGVASTILGAFGV